jgi:xanthine dehydrogenase YagR molybdenum-binding subunit
MRGNPQKANELSSSMGSTIGIGSPIRRVEGHLKVTGAATYTADHCFPDMAHMALVGSTIARGRIARIDSTTAETMPGVLRVVSHSHHRPAIYRPDPADREALVDESRPPFEDEEIYYYGQYVAAVVAETFEQAWAAAAEVRVEYRADRPNVSPDLSDGWEALTVVSERGNPDGAFRSCSTRIEQTYTTSPLTHNSIEPHASIAVWNGDCCTLYETTQSVLNQRTVLARFLGIPTDRVRVITKHLGAGFGGKLWPWPHAPLVATVARELNRPVKVVLPRKMLFTNVGHRPRTSQSIRLGTQDDGLLKAIHHDYVNDTALLSDYDEGCGEVTPYLYQCPNLLVRSAMVRRSIAPPTPMRCPGAAQGVFALESAMDELALKLDLDPVALRLLNEPKLDESNGRQFSSRHLQECLVRGAQLFGWAGRNPAVGSMRRGNLYLGLGMACTSFGAHRSACAVELMLRDDGTAGISCATQDIGTGTYTIFAQAVSAMIGVPIDRVDVTLGDSTLPPGPNSGNSKVTTTVLPAVAEAVHEVTRSLGIIAVSTDSPFRGASPDDITFALGRVGLKNQQPGDGLPFNELLKRANIRYVVGRGKSQAAGNLSGEQYSRHSYGAHYAEVTWDPEIVELRVSRLVTVLDAGKIVNPLLARNQIEGAILMGIGMTLFEETVYDSRTGAPVNANLADYLVCTCGDTPRLEIEFLEYPDMKLNEFGTRGIGEIGVAGVAPAITAAIHHATGVRIRSLPVRVENLITQLGAP